MIKKETTINGKQVILGYCYATEIAFRDMAGEDMSQFLQSVIKGLDANPKQTPDTKTSIMAIIASALSYYQSKDEESPITDKELMFDGTPDEIATAIGYIIVMYAEFYKIAGFVDEKKTSKTDGEPAKNA